MRKPPMKKISDFSRRRGVHPDLCIRADHYRFKRVLRGSGRIDEEVHRRRYEADDYHNHGRR